jgi:hypothetical protein
MQERNLCYFLEDQIGTFLVGLRVVSMGVILVGGLPFWLPLYGVGWCVKRWCIQEIDE